MLQRSESERSLATNVLSDYAGDDPDLLADLLMAADPKAYSILFPLAQGQSSQFLPLFQAEINKKAGTREVERNDKDQLASVRLGRRWPSSG